MLKGGITWVKMRKLRLHRKVKFSHPAMNSWAMHSEVFKKAELALT